MGRSEPCEFVRRDLPQAKHGLVLSLCDNKHSSSHYWTSGKILCANWSKTYRSNYLASKATTTKPAIVLRAPQRIKELLLPCRGMMGNLLPLCSAKLPHLYSHSGAMCWPLPALPFSLPWCAFLCVGVLGVIFYMSQKPRAPKPLLAFNQLLTWAEGEVLI